jgi:2-alkenal reductase
MKRNKSIVWVSLVVALALIGLTGCSTASLLSAGSTQLNAPAAAPTATPQPTVAPSITSDILAALEGTLEQVYQNVSPSVVYIEVLQQATGVQIPGLMPNPQQQPYQHGSGSGFVWDKEGHIVTNNHVIEGAERIKVTFFDGTTVEGTVVGANPDSDLAVVQVDVPTGELYPVTLADSTQVKVGELAIAIGNPFGLENTMTVGFISALGRSLPAGGEDGTGSYTIPNIIQTDAPINPGNSGGVLVNDQGQLVGVTAAIASPVRASAGIGFAIPSAIVQRVVPVLIEQGQYASPWLGISGTSLTPDLAQAMGLQAQQRGALVADVTPNGPAEQAGLRGSGREISVDGETLRVGGDVIVAIGGQPVETFDDLVAYLFTSAEVGQQVTLTVLRDGREQSVAVTLGERPVQQPTQSAESNPPSGEASQGVWLGITGVTLSPEIAQAMNLSADQQGVLIEQVAGGSPAEKAGLQGGHDSVIIQGSQVLVGGDVIVAWEGQQVTQFEQLRALVGESRPDQEVTLTVLRSGAQTEVKVTLEARSNQ